MLDSTGHRPRPIVVGTNGSQRGRAAVVRACILAYSRGSQLHVVSAHSLADSLSHRNDRTVAPRDIAYTLTPRQEASATVEEALAVARELGVEAVAHPTQGGVVQALASVAHGANAEAIVVGATAKRGWLAERLSPGIGRALVAANVCPVIVVDTAHGPVHRLIADGRRIVELGTAIDSGIRRAS
jgi:K+-sensing histidine kinase KdpD